MKTAASRKESGEFISPSDIRKYCYCPYQWYYEKQYGARVLRKKLAERNEALGITDSRLSHFVKGSDFHSRFRFEKSPLQKALIGALMAAAALVLAFAAALLLKGGWPG